MRKLITIGLLSLVSCEKVEPIPNKMRDIAFQTCVRDACDAKACADAALRLYPQSTSRAQQGGGK